MALKRLKIIYIGLLLILVSSVVARAQQEKVTEYQIKAAFIYNFTKFISWPQKAFASESVPFVVEILGDDPFGPSIEQLRALHVNDRSVDIQYAENDTAIKPCHVLFICASEKNRVNQILQKIKGQPVLTVSDIEGFSTKGGIIEFRVKKEQLRFLINLEAARSAGLRISYQLLSLAKEVIGK